MRQLITRIDEALHLKLKNLARRDGRSVNSLVKEVLERAVAEDEPVASYRLKALRHRVIPPQPVRPPSMRRVRELTRGSGDSVSREILRQRSDR